jgi:glycine cleavage system regulatory protein
MSDVNCQIKAIIYQLKKLCQMSDVNFQINSAP